MAHGFEVTDMSEDFKDGEAFLILLETLAGKKVSKKRKTIKSRSGAAFKAMWRRENVNNAIKQMEQMGMIRKNQAGADDILNGNVKIILSLVRVMINYCEENNIQIEGLG